MSKEPIRNNMGQVMDNSSATLLFSEVLDKVHKAKTKAKTDLLTSYSPFKIAQRYLALIFAFTFVGSYVMVLVLYFMGRDIDAVQDIVETFKINWICLTIIGFYFGGGAFEGIISKRKGQ